MLVLSFTAVSLGAALVCVGVGAVRVIRALGIVREHVERLKVRPLAAEFAQARTYAPQILTSLAAANVEIARLRTPVTVIRRALAVLASTGAVVRAEYQAVRTESTALRADVRIRTGL